MKSLGEIARNNSYYSLDSSKISKRQSEVLAIFKEKGAMSRRQAAEALGWPINAICPRIRELLNKCLLEEFRITEDPATGRPVSLLRICVRAVAT